MTVVLTGSVVFAAALLVGMPRAVRSSAAAHGLPDRTFDRPASRPYVAGGRPDRGVSTRTPLALVALVVVALVLLVPRPARADEAISEQSNLLVLQAISLIANDSGVDKVDERLRDALNAPDKADTDLAKVEQALTLIDANRDETDAAADLGRARILLEESINIRPATGYGAIPEPGEVADSGSAYASGADTGTAVVLDEVKPARGISDGGDAVLLTLSVVAVALGLFLSRRWRPDETISTLRRRSAALEQSR